MAELTFIDLFCGIGGFRFAAESFGWRCVFSSDIDPEARRAYAANFDEAPEGDIRQVEAARIPDHNILLAGFPCQPFSIIGPMRGLEDTRGTLFFEIARILEAKRPAWFALENVKQLASNNRGATLRRIMQALCDLGYTADWRILNALDFGLPQKRERVFIVGNRLGLPYTWPAGGAPMTPLAALLEKEVHPKHYVSARIRAKRQADHVSACSPSVWHENKAGHISSYPYSCALRASASYNYRLVDGLRRLTPREMLRLQGFPETFQIVCNDFQTRKQAGNAVAVPVVRAVLGQILLAWNRRAAPPAERVPALTPAAV